MDRAQPHSSGSSSRRPSNAVGREKLTAVSSSSTLDETTRHQNTLHGPSIRISNPNSSGASTSRHAVTAAASSTTPYIHPPFQPSTLSSISTHHPHRPVQPIVNPIVTAVSASASDASSTGGVRRRLSNPATSPIAPPTTAFTSTASGSAAHPRRRSRGDSLFTPVDLAGPSFSSPLAWFGNDTRGKRKKSSEDFDQDYSSDRSTASSKRVMASSRMTSDSDGSPPLHASKPLLHKPISNRPSYSSMSLTPLPTDPNNILPLSLPGTPYATPMHTPGVSPHPSMSDMKDYISQYTSSSSAGPSYNRSPSPRTSISTSTSSNYDSLSGDEVPFGRSAGWWARTERPRSTLRTARSKMISLPPLPTGARSWGWLMGMIRRSDSNVVKTKSRRFRPRRDTLREREKGKARHRESITGIGAIDRCLEALPAKAMTIVSFFFFCPRSESNFQILSLLAFGAFALFTTVTLRHVLNPDKTPLPWRNYCSASQPTVFSLQPDYTSSSYFGDRSSLALAPLTPSHPQWPYPTTETPSIAASLEMAPVGVFVGVFTTDEKADRRNMIRQSYGSHPRSRRSGTEAVKVMFIMGRPRRRYRKAVELESEGTSPFQLPKGRLLMFSLWRHSTPRYAREHELWQDSRFLHLGF